MVVEKLPKIWPGRIKKYWDKVMPANYPKSSSEFSLTFAGEELEAVDALEKDIATEAVAAVDEGYFAYNYVATYNVEGTPGEKTLLCPEAVELGDLEEVKALHYNETTKKWDNIEDIEVDNDGYVWGTLEEFSPIALIIVKRDIEVLVPEYFPSKKFVVCNGNPVSVYQDDNNDVFVKNLSSGTVVNYTQEGATHIIGGTADGIEIKTTSININGVVEESDHKVTIFGGSCWYADDNSSAYLDEANVICNDCDINGITGAGGAVRVNKFNLSINNSKFYYIANAQVTINNKDCNGHPDTSLADRQYVKNFNCIIKNSEIEWPFMGGNSGYTYTDYAYLKMDGCKVTGGLTCAGSNGTTNKADAEVINSNLKNIQSCNRGFALDINIKIKDSIIPDTFILGDATDSSVNGVTKKVKMDIDKGTYGVKIGTQAGVAPTKEIVDEVVTSVKISRSADYTISEEDKVMLGNKFIVK